MAGYNPSNKWTLDGTNGNAARATAIALEASTGALTGFLWDVNTPMEAMRFVVVPTVAFDYDTQTAEGVVSLFKRVTYDSDTGRVSIAAVRLIHGSAVGDHLYADIDAHPCKVGEQLIAEITTAATGGTEVGDFVCYVEVMAAPEQEGSMPKMINAAVAA